MPETQTGRYRVRYAESPADLERAQALRFSRFRAGGTAAPGRDQDAFDAVARHVLIEEAASGRLVCCFRLLPFRDGATIQTSYSAQFYGLGKLARYPGRMLELGRFCVAEGETDPAVLRVAWGALSEIMAAEKTELVFGCTSFAGIDGEAYAEAFTLLKDRHLGPRRWLPSVKASRVFRYASRFKLRTPDLKAAMRAMPPLLRTYLAMGGWVSDHAVVDRDLGTLHVLTVLEIGSVSAARRRALRA